MTFYKYLHLYILYLLSISLSLNLSVHANTLPELIPKEVLFGNPVKYNVLLSPDGKKLSYLAPVDNVLNIWIKTIGKEDDRPITNDKDRGIHYYFWSEDNRHILYAQDAGGNENWRLYAVDLETNKIEDLTPFEDIQVNIIKTNKNFPNELIFSMNKEDPRVHDMYRLNLISGDLTLVAKNPGGAIDWIIDSHFKVRGTIVAKSDGGFDLMMRDSLDSDWKILISWNVEDGLSSAPNFISPPTFFSKDGKYIFLMDSRGVNAGRLIKLEIATENIKVIAEDPYYDVSEYILIHPDNYKIQAVASEKARLEWTILDESIKDDFDIISKLDHGDFVIISRDNNDEKWLVSFEKDNGSVSYYIYNRKTKQGFYLFNQRPELDRYTLAKMEPISFTSRDGLTIHGYITYPPGKEKRNLPLVLEVHGGPWARNSWGYDPQAQWLANRGYACMQVNFRGSTGYGKDFLNAGNKEWGNKAHDDLVDGVHWIIEKGIVNPEKIAIYGVSYGGYAALVGATFTPDLFCCAIDICGPSNLITFIEAIPPWYSTLLATIYKRVGNPDTEKEFLKSRSPLFKAHRIKIPILIAQGANDPRVKQTESEQIVKVMEKNSVEYKYMLFPDEGHGIRKPENRLKFYATAEKFLAKFLGGRYEEGLEESDY